jgi:TonB family protein
MRRVAAVAAMVLCATFLLGSAASACISVPPAEARDISGRYRWKGDTTKTVTLIALTSGVYRAVGDGWYGTGLFENDAYWGVFRLAERIAGYGTHRGMLRPDGSLAVRGEFGGGGGKPFDVVWVPERGVRRPRQTGPPATRPEPPAAPPVVVVPPDSGQLPAFGDYVYIDELPEAMTKVPPEYPEAARAAKIEGTVLVQVLVGQDGRVKDTKITKSVPGLDEAAAACARQWVFKPALAGGKPVAVWVAVPIRFTLH